MVLFADAIPIYVLPIYFPTSRESSLSHQLWQISEIPDALIRLIQKAMDRVICIIRVPGTLREAPLRGNTQNMSHKNQ